MNTAAAQPDTTADTTPAPERATSLETAIGKIAKVIGQPKFAEITRERLRTGMSCVYRLNVIPEKDGTFTVSLCFHEKSPVKQIFSAWKLK